MHNTKDKPTIPLRYPNSDQNSHETTNHEAVTREATAIAEKHYSNNHVSNLIEYDTNQTTPKHQSNPISTDLISTSNTFDNFHQFSQTDLPNKPLNLDNSNLVFDESTITSSKYADYKHAPVGFDRVALFYRLDATEHFIDRDRREHFFSNGVYIHQQVLGGAGIYVSFNATTISKRTAYLPLSIRKYYDNFRTVENIVREHVLREFKLERCIISRLEVFKTLQLTQSPSDYAQCLKMLEVKGAYKKNYTFLAEGIGTFLIQNDRDEVMFYDKSSQWAKKLAKKNILLNMPEDMIRIEWRIQNPDAALARLGFKRFLSLIDHYDSIVDAYCSQQDALFHEIERTPRDKVVLTVRGISKLIKSLIDQGVTKPVTVANRMIFFYLLDYHGCLDAYVYADKGGKATYAKWQQEKAKYAAQLPFNENLRWIDLYNELRSALLDNNEISSPVSNHRVNHIQNQLSVN